ncbi:MAG: hypothetical protein ACM3WP_24015 [Acidobacteriota bacterium]
MPGEPGKLRPKVRGKVGRRFVQIGDHNYPVDFYIASDLHRVPANTIRKVAIYIYGEFAPEARLTVLRGIARERGWEITGEFIDSGEQATADSLGPGLEELLEHSHQLLHDTCLQWLCDHAFTLRRNPHL